MFLRGSKRLERLELSERLEPESALGRDFKNHALHEWQRVSQCKNLPAEFIIDELSGNAGKFLSIDSYFDRRVLDHVLAPVLAFYFAGGRIIAAVAINQAQLYGPWLAGFSSDCRKIRD